MSKIVQLYADNENIIKAYPKTLSNCVFDENGNSVKEQLDSTMIKNNWFINISELLPNGITDISDHIIQAIDMLPSQGGTVILPCDKEYTISKLITITKPNVVLKGNSQYFNTIINVTCPIGILVLAYGFECDKVRFIGNGTQEGGLDATNTAIVVGDGIYTNYDNFLFNNSQCFKFGTAIIIKTRNFIIQNSTFSWCLNGLDVQGLTFNGVTQSDRRNYKISDNRFHVCWGTALKLSGNVAHAEVQVNDNQFDRCMDNIIGYCEDSLITDNIITISRGKGIYIDSTNFACGGLGLTICNNTISSWVGVEKNIGDGIYVKADNTIVRGNKISRKNGNGIQVIGNNCEIASNNTTDSSYFTDNTFSGILVNGNFNMITNNFSKNIKGTTQKYGIEITSNSQGCVMSANMINGQTGQTNTLPPSTQGNTYEGLSRGLRFGSGIPNNSEGQRGDYVINKLPQEFGDTGNKYIIHGWQKVLDYLGGTTWVEVRTLTGR